MGSKLNKVLAIQQGRQTTNPNGLSPNPSRPIEQVSPTLNKTFQPIEQKAPLRTARNELTSTEFSKPIQQFLSLNYPSLPGRGQFIQQFILNSAITNPDYDGLVEQVVKVGTIKPQQFILRTGLVSNTSRPVEQVPRPSNTIQVEQFDFIELITPVCNSIKNPINTNIRWRIKDFGFPFDTSSLIFVVDGVQVQDFPSFSITPIVNGLELFYDPVDFFPYDYEVQIFLQIQDTDSPPNTFTYNCRWTTTEDTKAPIFHNITPPCGSTGVAVTSDISFDVVDAGIGVNPDSIRLSIEGVTVCSGISKTPVTILGSGTGYHVTYENPGSFNFDSEIALGFQATDLSDNQNASQFICSFSTESSDPPVFVNVNPEPCETFVDNHTGLTFEVYGVEHGVDISTLEVIVDKQSRKVIVQPRIYRAD